MVSPSYAGSGAPSTVMLMARPRSTSGAVPTRVMTVYFRPFLFGVFERVLNPTERVIFRAAFGLGTARRVLAKEVRFADLPVITYSLSWTADSPSNFRFARLRPVL